MKHEPKYDIEFKANLYWEGGVEDELIAIRIIPSGWSAPQLYHVLIEYGDDGSTDYKQLTAEQIKDNYDIEVGTVNLTKISKSESNNYIFGSIIRNLNNPQINVAKITDSKEYRHNI